MVDEPVSPTGGVHVFMYEHMEHFMGFFVAVGTVAKCFHMTHALQGSDEMYGLF